MARSKQSVKRHRTDVAKTRRNLGKMRAMRTAIRRVHEAETPEARDAAFRKAQSLIDRAGRTRLIHPNKADRLKGRLSSSLGTLPGDPLRALSTEASQNPAPAGP